MSDDIKDDIAAEIERETRASRYRDSCSGEKVHPIDHDLNALITYVIAHHHENPTALDAARRCYRMVDTRALRILVRTVRDGTQNAAILRICERVEEYANTIDAALALRPRVH